jgi:hypothetical protein
MVPGILGIALSTGASGYGANPIAYDFEADLLLFDLFVMPRNKDALAGSASAIVLSLAI